MTPKSKPNVFLTPGAYEDFGRLPGKWRILYVILEEAPIIFGIRHRPPYDYQDIQQLIDNLE